MKRVLGMLSPVNRYPSKLLTSQPEQQYQKRRAVNRPPCSLTEDPIPLFLCVRKYCFRLVLLLYQGGGG
jgi:hypothetical protein